MLGCQGHDLGVHFGLVREKKSEEIGIVIHSSAQAPRKQRLHPTSSFLVAGKRMFINNRSIRGSGGHSNLLGGFSGLGSSFTLFGGATSAAANFGAPTGEINTNSSAANTLTVRRPAAFSKWRHVSVLSWVL
jgi:hypothetical protein